MANPTQKHSLLPWAYKRAKLPVDGAYDCGISTIGTTEVIAETFGRTGEATFQYAEANAEFIVRAVTAHYDLLAAAKLFEQTIQYEIRRKKTEEPWDDETPRLMTLTLNIVQCAIAKAEGE